MYTIEEFDEQKTKVLKYILYKRRSENEIRNKFSSVIKEELLEDICIATGATLIGRDVGITLKDFDVSHLGVLEQAIITMEDSILKFADVINVELVKKKENIYKKVIRNARNSRSGNSKANAKKTNSRKKNKKR